MDEPIDPLYLMAGLVALGVAAQWAAARLKIPAIVLLLGLGLLIGPFTGLVRPSESFGDLLAPGVALAVALILFEGGLSLRISEARKLGGPLLGLVLGGLLVTFATTTWLALEVIGLSLPTAAVLGAILVVTGPTVVKPMLRHARLARRPALLLKWESIINDALGALLAVVVLEIVVVGPERLDEALLWILAAGFLGLLAGAGLGHALVRGAIPEHLKAPAILAGALTAFAASDALMHEAGLLAVTVMGVVLANTRSSSVEGVRQFKEEVATILVSVLFLVLSADLEMEQIKSVTLPTVAFIAAVVFVVRPLVGAVALFRTGLPWRERLLVGWVAPRGVVAAAVGGAFAPKLIEAGYEDAAMLVPVLFGVILSTVVLHGLTTAPLARKLGLSGAGGGGLLIVGSSGWAVDLALALSREKIDAVVVDSNFRNVVQARMRGVEAVHGDVLDEETLDELPIERLSWVLAATGDDHYNSLVCVGLVVHFGRENVLQLRPADFDGASDSHLVGRMAWDETASFAALSSRYWRGAHFRVTKLDDDEHDWEDFVTINEDAAPLFLLGERSTMAPIDEDTRPKEGDRIVYLPAP